MKATIEDGVLYSPYPKVDIPSCSIYTAISKFLTKQPDQLAVIDEKIRLTRGEFLARMKRFAAGFQAHGVGLGDRVCVHLENSVDNLVALLSLTFTGASVLLSNPVLNERELLFQIQHSNATHVLTSARNATKVLAVRRSASIKKAFISGDDMAGFFSTSSFADISEDNFEEVPIEDPKSTTVALFYSSGTTGDAKGMEISHQSVVANLHTQAALLNNEPKDVLLAWHPITYASGFMFVPVAACAGSTCVIVHPGMSFDDLVGTVNKYQITSLASAPTRLYYYVADMIRTGTKLPSVKKIGMGGTVLTQEFAKQITAAFDGLVSMRNNYSLSESCGVICSTPYGELAPKSVGFPAPMVELKFLDLNTGKKVGPMQYGELYFRIPSAMKGYYKNHELTRKFMDAEGWCRSGDVMYYDEDGRVYFVDRLKDTIICLDQQVSSCELESLLQSHGCVVDAAVVGVPDTRYGDAPAAFVVTKRSDTPPSELAAELKRLIAGKTETFKHLYGGVVFIDRLPRNGSGKVIKHQLTSAYKDSTVY
ncbi:luciferin 4-monooxygenase-like [Haemaphysalis longicornis]